MPAPLRRNGDRAYDRETKSIFPFGFSAEGPVQARLLILHRVGIKSDHQDSDLTRTMPTALVAKVVGNRCRKRSLWQTCC